ncbi:MAG: hypothetical protein AAGF87_10485, partial [Bacteroidota bacterium]
MTPTPVPDTSADTTTSQCLFLARMTPTRPMLEDFRVWISVAVPLLGTHDSYWCYLRWEVGFIVDVPLLGTHDSYAPARPEG